MRGDAEVGLQQPRAALGVRHPAVVEVHAAALEPELRAPARAPPRWRRARRARQRRPPDAEEDEVDVVGQERHGADRGRRVEPVPDPAAPQQDARRRPAGERGAQPAARAPAAAAGTPNGTTSRPAARRARPSSRAQERHPAEPQVALALGRADHEVGRREVRGGGAARDRAEPRRAPRRAGAAPPRAPRRRSGCRGRRRAGRGRATPRQQPRRQQLRDHDVVRRERGEQRVVVGEPGLEQRRVRVAGSPPGAASVTAQSPASARASSRARIAGPAIRSPTGSAETTRTRGSRAHLRAAAPSLPRLTAASTAPHPRHRESRGRRAPRGPAQ